MSQYDEKFFASLEEDSRNSANVVVPFILNLINCQSVIDVGCGNGVWLSVFQQNGINTILGIDGEYVQQDMLRIPSKSFLAFDLSKPIKLNSKYDLAMSVEVAEHLPETSAKSFVTSLTNLADIVLFSAAIPAQEGTHHINEQWADYWIKLFEKENYVVIDCLRKQIWDNQNVAWWYKQNLFIFVNQAKLTNYPNLVECLEKDFSLPKQIVHPKIFMHKVNKLKELEGLLNKPIFQLANNIYNQSRRFKNSIKEKLNNLK